LDGGGGGVMSDVVVGFSQYRRRLLLMRRAAVVVQSLIAFCTARFPAVKSSGRDATSAAAVRSNDNSMEITIEASFAASYSSLPDNHRRCIQYSKL